MSFPLLVLSLSNHVLVLSGTKWWDFAEIFEFKAEQFLDFTLALLLNLAASHHVSSVKYTYEGISNAPDKFFDAFWFNRIPI